MDWPRWETMTTNWQNPIGIYTKNWSQGQDTAAVRQQKGCGLGQQSIWWYEKWWRPSHRFLKSCSEDQIDPLAATPPSNSQQTQKWAMFVKLRRVYWIKWMGEKLALDLRQNPLVNHGVIIEMGKLHIKCEPCKVVMKGEINSWAPEIYTRWI